MINIYRKIFVHGSSKPFVYLRSIFETRIGWLSGYVRKTLLTEETKISFLSMNAMINKKVYLYDASREQIPVEILKKPF